MVSDEMDRTVGRYLAKLFKNHPSPVPNNVKHISKPTFPYIRDIIISVKSNDKYFAISVILNLPEKLIN